MTRNLEALNPPITGTYRVTQGEKEIERHSREEVGGRERKRDTCVQVNLDGATVKIWVKVQSGTKDRMNSWTLRAPKVAYEYSTLK